MSHLERRPHGLIALQLRRAYTDGTNSFVFSELWRCPRTSDCTNVAQPSWRGGTVTWADPISVQSGRGQVRRVDPAGGYLELPLRASSYVLEAACRDSDVPPVAGGTDASRAAVHDIGTRWPIVRIQLFGWTPDGWTVLEIDVARNHWVAGDVPFDGTAAIGQLTDADDGEVRYLMSGWLHVTQPGLENGVLTGARPGRLVRLK